MNPKKCLAAAAVVAVALAFAACGRSASPSSPTAGTSTSGATINGTVSGLTASAGATGVEALDATSGITVTIAGSSLAVAVDASGKFVFTGVPTGTVQLVFTTASGTATITLDGIKDGDTIKVKVLLKGATAVLDEEERNGAEMTEFEGQIAAINPEGTTRTIDVESTRVSVPASAAIRHGSTTIDFASLKVGNRVHVRGAMNGTLLEATEVKVQNSNQNAAVNFTGTISGLAGACPAVVFKAGGWTVETSATTTFQKTPCASLANSLSVHVKGTVQDSGNVLATSIQAK